MAARPRRRWLCPLVLAGSLALLAAAGAALYLHRTRRPDCESASRTAPDDVVVPICQEEYERTHHPATGARLALALLGSGNRTAATALANELLATEARPDALWILGEVAMSERRMADALDIFQEARKLDREEQRHAAIARDALSLAKLHGRRGSLADALYALDECITESRLGFDHAVEGQCHVTAARVLNLAGYFDGVDQELDLAEPLLTADRDRAKLWLERGNALQEQSRGKEHALREASAVAAFKRALDLATRARATELVLSAELNLAFSLAELGHLDAAALHHRAAAGLDQHKTGASDLAQIAARIAYRRGDLARAAAMNASLYSTMPPGDDRFEVCVMQARIALAQDDRAAAELWARRGIQEVDSIRAAQTALELRPWMLASRRAAYEILFVALARAGRFDEAVAVFDRWQGHTLLEAMSRPELGRQPALREMASKIQSLAQLMPAASRAPLMSSEDRDIAATLRAIDLFGLAIAEGDVWRMTVQRGRLRIERIGSLEELSPQLDSFQARPTEPALATAVGERLVPAELFGEASTLHVVLDRQLASLPVVALRRGGQPLIAARPVLRLQRLPAAPDRAAGAAGATCAVPARLAGATVLADADPDPRFSLPSARTEAEQIAPLLETTPHVGAAATSTALFAAKSHSVLHVAVHANFNTYGGVLRLYDRAVSALEIATHRLGPPLVVLSGCTTALSGDPELAGSLSTAFLASGSSHVIATLRKVIDKDAAEVMHRFYDRGGIADPVRTLAAIQRELVRDGNNKDWPNFAVFGNDACVARDPGGTR